VNEQDKVLARRALEKKRLSIHQVEQILAEAARTGRSFREIALGRGLLSAPDFQPPPPKQVPLPYLILLGVSLTIFSVLLVTSTLRLRERSQRDDDLAVEQSKNMTEAEKKSAEARRGYQRSIVEAREARARQALAKARDAMARADDRLKTAPSSPDLPLALNEAFVGYNGYLDVLPDDADVRIERSRTHILRRNYDLAIADLDRAAELKPDRAPALRDQIAQLRLLLARTPK